jgi:hypothetical protein
MLLSSAMANSHACMKAQSETPLDNVASEVEGLLVHCAIAIAIAFVAWLDESQTSLGGGIEWFNITLCRACKRLKIGVVRRSRNKCSGFKLPRRITCKVDDQVPQPPSDPLGQEWMNCGVFYSCRILFSVVPFSEYAPRER